MVGRPRMWWEATVPGPAMHKPYPFLSQEDPCARQVGGVLAHLERPTSANAPPHES